jgi:hypothetical protein
MRWDAYADVDLRLGRQKTSLLRLRLDSEVSINEVFCASSILLDLYQQQTVVMFWVEENLPGSLQSNNDFRRRNALLIYIHAF